MEKTYNITQSNCLPITSIQHYFLNHIAFASQTHNPLLNDLTALNVTRLCIPGADTQLRSLNTCIHTCGSSNTSTRLYSRKVSRPARQEAGEGWSSMLKLKATCHTGMHKSPQSDDMKRFWGASNFLPFKLLGQNECLILLPTATLQTAFPLPSKPDSAFSRNAMFCF